MTVVISVEIFGVSSEGQSADFLTDP
eukprot:UN09300